MSQDGRMRRFLHLERARPAGPMAEPAPKLPDPTEERIAGLEEPNKDPAPSPPHRTGAELERFGPEPEPSLELVPDGGKRPFSRCRSCGQDNSAFATLCQGCGERLDTPEQQEFDERFFLAREAEEKREALAQAARQKERERAEAEEGSARQAMGEAIAREVGESEGRRLDPGLSRGGPGQEWSSLGMRTVQKIPDSRWHVPVFAAAVGLATVLAGWGIHADHWAATVAGGAALLLLLVHLPR